MLKIGLTGSLGSGKSTVADMLRNHGAQIVEADALGRELMEPGQAVYEQIAARFGAQVVGPDGRLNRVRLAQLAFREGCLQDLNAIVHPAVIAEQQRWMEELFARHPSAIAVLESALIFEVVRDARARGDSLLADWRRRIHRIIVVTAPDDLKIERYVARIAATPAARAAAEADARLRLSHQIPDAEKAAKADYVLDNAGDLASLAIQVAALWPRLVVENLARSNKFPAGRSLQ